MTPPPFCLPPVVGLQCMRHANSWASRRRTQESSQPLPGQQVRSGLTPLTELPNPGVRQRVHNRGFDTLKVYALGLPDLTLLIRSCPCVPWGWDAEWGQAARAGVCTGASCVGTKERCGSATHCALSLCALSPSALSRYTVFPCALSFCALSPCALSLCDLPLCALSQSLWVTPSLDSCAVLHPEFFSTTSGCSCVLGTYPCGCPWLPCTNP